MKYVLSFETKITMKDLPIYDMKLYEPITQHRIQILLDRNNRNLLLAYPYE